MKRKGDDKLWVELEALGCPALLEGLCRLRGAVMKAVGVGGPSLLLSCV